MSDPIVQPDVTKVPTAIVTTEKAVEPFLPAKARAAIYLVGGVLAAACPAAATAIGGTIGTVLDVIGATAAGIVGVTAVSHISK